MFSKRYGFKPQAAEIKIREDAPDAFRAYLLTIMYPHMGLKDIRTVICRAVKEAPNPGNWSENEFMRSEIEGLIMDAKWYYVYDAIELFSHKLSPDKYIAFECELNDYFMERGIGWQLKDKVIELRGEDAFEATLGCAKETLNAANVPTSANEIKEAIKDLSRRPDPEITGAIQHSVTALECLSRKVTNEPTMTLGRLIKENPQIVPQPLNDVVSKIFGFASIKGRHLEEGNDPTFEEAELIVHLSAAICTYLCKTAIL